MRRSICYTEPGIALAGEVNTWRFIYTPAHLLPKGTRLKFDIQSKGRDIDWQVPEVDLKKNSNLIYMTVGQGKKIAAKEVELLDSFVPQYEFTLPADVKAETPIVISLGSPSDTHSDKKGNQAQNITQRRKEFLLYVDPSGKGKYEEPERFHIDIKGNFLTHIQILAPSLVSRNNRFDVMIRFEDKYGNLTNNAPENTLIEFSHNQQRENLHWRLFVPETGFLTVPNFYFNEPGVYIIELKNLENQKVYSSSPVKCVADEPNSIFWSLLHGESEKIDSIENIDACLRHFRDDQALNVFATSCFEALEETSNDSWKQIQQSITEFNEMDRFVSLLGFQWQGESEKEGLRHILYAKDAKPILRKSDQRSSSLKKLYKLFQSNEIISIPCFTMAKSSGFNFEDFHPIFERVVEIYNAWGSSECSEKEGNLFPISFHGKIGVASSEAGSIRRALNSGLRFGFTAGGLDDRGPYATFYDNDQIQYPPGLTAIISKEYSREGVFDALKNRRCYATTGEKIILGFFVSMHPMGSEISTKEKPGLIVNRHLSGYVVGTGNIESIEIICNGAILHSIHPKNKSHVEIAYDDMTPIDHRVIVATNKNATTEAPFVYYYLKATQVNGATAWSSPIWVDHTGSLQHKKKLKK